MPNWCKNTLTVTGPNSDLEYFKTFVSSQSNRFGEKAVLSLNSILPMPQEAIADYANIGHDWCCKNWGTKKDALESRVIHSINEKLLVYFFSTANSPPIECFNYLSEVFPKLNITLTFNSYESNYHGYVEYKEGKQIKREIFEFNDGE